MGHVEMRTPKLLRFAVLMAVIATSFGCGAVESAAPSAAECVEDWNDRSDRSVRAEVMEGGYEFAAVRGWVANESYPGCSIRFGGDHGTTFTFLSCSRTFTAAHRRLRRWQCEPESSTRFEPDQSVARAEVMSGWQLTI